MQESSPNEVSRMLAAGQGVEALLPLVYDELRRMAQARLERLAPGQSLEATSLVHEAYVKLLGEEHLEWSSLGCFYAAAARSMRNLLVDRARSKARAKRGGAARRVSVEIAQLEQPAPPEEMLALAAALTALELHDARKHEVVMLRYFAGLSIEDTAQALGLSHASVERDWTYAKAWLRRKMAEAETQK